MGTKTRMGEVLCGQRFSGYSLNLPAANGEQVVNYKEKVKVSNYPVCRDWIDTLKTNGMLWGKLCKLKELVKRHNSGTVKPFALRKARNEDFLAKRAAVIQRIDYARLLWPQITDAPDVLSNFCRKVRFHEYEI
ncbi:hypothetical protein D918_05220 [Trichuris suis]|nr:hypothetical protein D918_05220 [Trichuris suis]